MIRPLSETAPTRAQIVTQKAFRAIEHFMHIEAVSGIVLLVAAAFALAWASSPWAHSYHDLWHTPVSIGIGDLVFSRSLHFWINDVLMTVFFLVVGMEIRREIHDGALASLRLAALPIVAALGGVTAPALIYLAINGDPLLRHGWAVPTATDIAFAVGVMALLGRSIPGNLRILLLALAIIDDIVAVIIIALFYSGGLDYSGLMIAALGIVAVLGLQWIGIGNAYAYVVPGAIIWLGLLQTGAHPTLAGVVLGLMTPVFPMRAQENPLTVAERAMHECVENARAGGGRADVLIRPLRQLRLAQRELVPPVVRVQQALHPWVAFGIMPLFALANAGVSLGDVDAAAPGFGPVMFGVALALVVGKPLGVMLACWAAVRLGISRLPPQVTWPGVLLVGLLAGIGFTMSIFIANLAFDDATLLAAAKFGVLLASTSAAVLGLIYGLYYARASAG
ncbi:Na+/H+ antiporter NhaA [Pseudochelatococcus lubricantis]|uniref:Na+/H+ antiporter NhaA n=1 Tax=Pseudochelatococcus lubricantis TaxID=1538102 RepID=UPI0035E87F57